MQKASNKERLQALGMSRIEEGRLRDDMIPLLKYLKACHLKEGSVTQNGLMIELINLGDLA